MNMPAKGKHHSTVHHHQSHSSHLQSHVLGVNLNQPAGSNLPQSTQHFNSTVLNNTPRFIPHSGQDFHVTGQNFNSQSTGQMGGSGLIGLSNTRGSLGNISSISQNSTGLSLTIAASGQSQPTISNMQSQLPQNSNTSSPVLHNSSNQDMNKQTQLQTSSSSLQQVFVQNQVRSASQNYYSNPVRSQQVVRNPSHRNAQPGNHNQIIGIAGVNSTGGQPSAIYPHPSISIQPSTMYVQGQVSGIHTNPHQQNVYPINNQIPMQYSGPPARHQAPQNQYPYQSYQTHALLATSSLFGFTHGSQHQSFFYHQPPNPQLNLGRTNTNTVVNSNSQHISGPLSSAQGAQMLPQGTLQQPNQQSQPMHSINLPLSQAELYPTYNNGISNASGRSKKPRDKAIKDIVNPNTGKNISAEIYKDDGHTSIEKTNFRELQQSPNCDAELVVADFAARVAKLASETTSSVALIEKSSTTQKSSKNEFKTVECCSSVQLESDLCNLVDDNLILKLNQDKSNLVNAEPVPCEEINFVLVQEKNVNSVDDALKKEEEEKNIKAISLQLLPTIDKSIFDWKTEFQPSVVSVEKKVETFPKDKLYTLDMHNQANHISKKTDGDSDIKNVSADSQISDNQQKFFDGKTMQKQKNKNKMKGRELNRKGAEKEGTDMDAFVNSVQVNSSEKIGTVSTSELQKNIENDNVELTKNIKEKDNYESKKEKDFSESDILSEKLKENSDCCSSDSVKKISIEQNVDQKNIQDHETCSKETFEYIPAPAEVVTLSSSEKNINNESISLIVAKKNQENSKNSILVPINNLNDEAKVNNVININISTETLIPVLKYTYLDDQWSPVNTSGKKIYDRDFLMKLQNDPNSKIKPSNLPDLDVVLKDCSKNRSPVDFRFKDNNSLGRHDSLLPGFVKTTLSAKVPLPSKKSHSVKPKSNKPSMISFSLKDDVKLHETENAWKPDRFRRGCVSEEQNKTDALYKRVRSVLNKLTPQKFDTLVNQVRELQIDTQERLQGVINLVFEKAVDEPNFSVAYALMCKELSNIEVIGAESEVSSSANFRKLILNRCQTEFEKNTVDENARSEKLKEIEDCTNPEKKKELQINFEEEERRIRVKSVGNIRFIGELFKQNMLTSKIMIQCISHLLRQVDEESLECLCKLLTTIGKVLESKSTNLSEYFNDMQKIANRKGKISSRIRFMLQDVIDLRANKWIPRRDDSNPKTMEQIQKEAESERLDTQFSNSVSSTPRKEDRTSERKRNRGGGGTVEDGGWSQPVGRTRPVYSVETAKLKNKPPSLDDMQLGNRTTYQWPKPNPKMTTPNKYSYLENIPSDSEKRGSNIHLSGSRSTGSREYNRLDFKSNYDVRGSRNGSYQISSSSYARETPTVDSARSQSLTSTPAKNTLPDSILNLPHLTDEKLREILNKFLKEYIIEDGDIKEAIDFFKNLIPASSHISFINRIVNDVLEKTDHHRNRTSQILSQLLSQQCISLSDFKIGLGKILEAAEELIIDVPKLWKYFAKILVHPVIDNITFFSELQSILKSLPQKLWDDGFAAIIVIELLIGIKEIKGDLVTAEIWKQNNLILRNFCDCPRKLEQISNKSEFKFLNEESQMSSSINTSSLDYEKYYDQILKLLKESNFDEIYSWIRINFEDKTKDPKFIRILMTSILESSIEQCNDKWTFKVENFEKIQKLIQRFVDADEYLELQCLFAVQAYITKLSHPTGLLLKIMTCLCENNLLSNEAFLAWEKNDDVAEKEGKSEALMSLKSFFIPLKEVEDVSSDE